MELGSVEEDCEECRKFLLLKSEPSRLFSIFFYFDVTFYVAFL